MNSFWSRGTALFLVACTTAGSCAFGAGRLDLGFRLERPGYVTLVVDDSSGVRVRNLVSEVPLDTGEHTVGWDLASDSVLVDDSIPGVAPEDAGVPGSGVYRIRGLIRDRVDLRYEFTVYNPGTPPWETLDGTGQWLADHTAPAGAVYVPETNEVIITAEVSESSAGVIWVDSTGRKTFEIDNVSGWRCPSVMTRDPVTGRVFGAISTGELYEFTDKQAVRLGDVLGSKMRGIAAYDNLVVVSKRSDDQLAMVDVSGTPQLLRFVAMPSPRGLAFDEAGRLLVLSDSSLYRGRITVSGLAEPETLITGLDSPVGLTLDHEDNIYLGLWGGNANNVVVYDTAGNYLRAIGTPGPETPGPYDSTHMVRPFGMTVDGLNRLWVAETNYIPKRVSVWELDGTLVRYFLGPTKYGGGGVVCPCDSTRFFYADERTRGSMEFVLDWEKGTWDLKNILGRWMTAQTPFCHEGAVYLTNEHAGYPTSAPSCIEVFTIDSGVALPIAAVGAPPQDSILRTAPFSSLWDPGSAKDYLYLWSDLNLDHERQAGEVTFAELEGGDVRSCRMDDAFGVTMSTDGGVCHLPLERFTADGVPEWDPAGLRALTALKAPAVRTPDSIAVLHGEKLRGVRAGQLVWTYPNPWPGVHESWDNQVPPTHPGQIIGGTIWLYNTVRPRSSDIGELVALNGNMGNIYLLSSDGLFVATLFQHFRDACRGLRINPSRGTGRGWHIPEAERGMLVNDVSLGEEAFWPNVVQMSGGDIYAVAGHEHSSIVRLEGLESIRRISLGDVELDSTALQDGGRFDLAFAYVNPASTRPLRPAVAVRPAVRIAARRLIVDGAGEPFELRVYNAAGAVVKTLRSSAADGRSVCDLRRLPAGVYVYRLRQGSGRAAESGTVMLLR